MANWKLRKDKAPTDTLGAETETPPTEAPFLDTVPGLPDFDAADPHLTSIDFDHEAPSPTDGPLTLVDYTAGDEAAPQEPHAQVYDQIYDTLPSSGSAFAMPPPASVEQAADGHLAEENLAEGRPMQNEDLGFETLPAASSWLSSDFSADTPAVAPFVLDTPAPTAAPPAAPQITVHIGRLSALFDLTKDVTTIGRPDSVLPYYPDVEIEMDDAVSRRHAEIVKREGGYYLVDTGSTNGTRLNGDTLLPHQEHLLAHGDCIHLGDRTEITFG